MFYHKQLSLILVTHPSCCLWKRSQVLHSKYSSTWVIQHVPQRTSDQGGEPWLFLLRSCRAQATPHLLLQGSAAHCASVTPAPAQLCPSGECLPQHGTPTCPKHKNNMEFPHGRASKSKFLTPIISVASHVLCPLITFSFCGTSKKF